MITIKRIINNINKNYNEFFEDVKSILQNLLSLQNAHDLMINNDYKLTKNELCQFEKMFQELINNKPVSKIIGNKGFWKRDFYTNENSLDPRADSECLIESVLQFAPKNKSLKILELGLGTGCLLFSVLDELSKTTGHGLEKSWTALQIAQKNNPYVSRTRLFHGSWRNIDNIFSNQKFDIIISNPPYIRILDWPNLADNVRKFDPVQALNGGHNGMYAYREIHHNLSNIAHHGTLLFLEIGQNQEHDVIKIYNKEFDLLAKNKDLTGIVRCLIFRKK